MLDIKIVIMNIDKMAGWKIAISFQSDMAFRLPEYKNEGRKDMYNLSGIYYMILIHGAVAGLVGILLLIGSRFWNEEKRNKSEFIISVLIFCYGICSIGYYSYVAYKPDIEINEGVFVKEERESRSLARREYWFSKDGDKEVCLRLNTYSKKSIYPDDFVKGDRYCVYYEGRTDIIIKVEKIE